MKRFMQFPFFSRSVFANVLIYPCLISVLLLTACASSKNAGSDGGKGREYLAIRVYHAADDGQLSAIDQYLQSALLPAYDREGFQRIGVFRAIDNDTAKDKRMYVMVPVRSLSQLDRLAAAADQSLGDSVTAASYTRAAYNKAPYSRFETIVLQAFEGMPQVKPSGATGEQSEKVYELRSYESATEALHRNKVQMFNSGEVTLFDRLGFNAVFYGRVIAGSRMPNLMYMTSFSNKASRDEHWKAFGSDPEWKKMSSDPFYKNNVSHIDITFLRPAAYSKL